MTIRLRLALWYGLLTGAVVILISFLGYATHSRAHYDALDESLGSVADQLASRYASAARIGSLSELLTQPIAPGIAARVYGASGEVLAAGPNAVTAPPFDPRDVVAHPAGSAFDPLVGLAPRVVPREEVPGVFGLVASPEGGRWRVLVLPAEGTAQYLTVAATLDELDNSVAAFRRLVILLIAIGGAITLAGGVLLAGQVLQPVTSLTRTAGAIARSRNFSRRVPVANRRDELGQLAETFNEMLASLEQAYRAEQRFVSDASHELRAPLTVIQANLELLERQREMSPAERQKAIAEASREARRLARLVADLLALARADAGLPMRRVRVELDRVLLDAFAEARHLALGQRLEIGALEPTLVEGDSDRLKQLLLILLDNAVKYTPAGGTVTLGLRRNGATAELSVRDTGVGIGSEDLPHVFERFYRADPARGRDPGGTGLGLPIARSIVEQHNGDITIESKPDVGTAITIHLPTKD